MNTPDCARLIVVGLAALAVAGTASGQEAKASAPASASGGAGLDLGLSFGGSYLFDTDIDDGGEISVASVGTRIDTRITLDDKNSLSVGFLYEFDSYDFSGSRGLAALDPWEDVHNFALRTVWSMKLDNAWTVFAGPTVALSAEDGAVTTNAMTFGGQVGARVRVSDTLALGFGVMAMSQIDDDARIIPLVSAVWDFADDWTLRAGALDRGSRLGGRPGVEVGWRFAEDWDLAFGAAYARRRFRLDDGGVAPDGVGEYEAFPLFARLTWDLASATYLSLAVGVAFEGKLTLENDDGRKITDEDFDAAPFIGLRFSHRF